MSAKNRIIFMVLACILSGCGSRSPSVEDASVGAAGSQVPAVYFSDPNNCGKLGRICAENETCKAGSCVDVSQNRSCGEMSTSCSRSGCYATGVGNSSECDDSTGPSTRYSGCRKNQYGAYFCAQTIDWLNRVNNVNNATFNCDFTEDYCACFCLDGLTYADCVPFGRQLKCQEKCDSICLTHAGATGFCRGYTKDDLTTKCPALMSFDNIITCPAPYVSSGGKCVYPFSDPNNCGTAGNKCYSDPTNKAQGRTACFSGVCSKPNPRFIFISGNLFSFPSGTRKADEICQAEAFKLGLPGTYKATLALKDKSLWDIVGSFASADRDVFSPNGVLPISTKTFSFNRMSGPLPRTRRSTCSESRTPAQSPPLGVLPGLDCVNQGFNSSVIFRNLSNSPGLFVTGVPVGGSIGAPGTNSDSFYTLASEPSTCNNWTSTAPTYGTNNVGVGNNLNTNWAGYNFYHNPDYSCLGSAPVLCLQTDDPKIRRVFVTSTAFKTGTDYDKANSPNTFKSATQADTACNDLGNAAMPGTKWAAWLATNTQSPIDRIIPSRIQDGDTADVYNGATLISRPVTKTKAQKNFASSCKGGTASQADCPDSHLASISLDEYGAPVGLPQSAYTGIDSSDFDVGTNTCKDWTSNSNSDQFVYGVTHLPTRVWHSSATSSCNNASGQRLYCIEVDK